MNLQNSINSDYLALLWIILTCITVAGLSIVLCFFVARKIPTNKLNLMVAFSAGSLLSAALLYLVPEALEHKETEFHSLSALLLVALMFFYFLEKTALKYKRYDQIAVETNASRMAITAWISTCGDAVHNFIDGLLIAAAFMIDPWLGITSAAAILAHEIPQEIGDFALSLVAGWSMKKALVVNLVSSTSLLLGGIVGWILIDQISTATPYMLMVAAGNFIYISLSKLFPFLNNHQYTDGVGPQAALLVFGLIWIPILGELIPH